MAVARKPLLAREGRAALAARRAGDLALRLHLPLVAIYAVAAGVAVHYGLKVETWKVMTDELQYARLALSFEEERTLSPLIHGENLGGYSLLYPWLIAPVYALLDAPEAFKAVHVLNGLVMASAVFPAYLIARGAGLSRWFSYLAAALAVAVPWLTMVTLIFTEVAAYPAFLWAVAGMQRALHSPSPRSDLLALGGLLLAFFARTQFVILAVLLPLAILVHEVGLRALERPRPPLRAALPAALHAIVGGHRLLLAAYTVGLAGIVLLLPGGFDGVLGSYTSATSGDLLPPGIARGSGLNLVLIGLAVGLVPAILAAGWAVAALVRPPGRREHALAVIVLLLVPALVLLATSYNLRFQLGFSQERYQFYVAPLLLIGMLACLAGRSRPWLGIAAAGGTAAWLLTLADLSPREVPLFSQPSAGFYQVLDGRVYELGQTLGFSELDHESVIVAAAVLATLALAAAVRYLPKAAVTAVVGLAVLAYAGAETLYLFPRAAERGTGGPLSNRIPLEQRDWIDEGVPEDASVALVPGTIGDDEFFSRVIWWGTELFNKRATDTFSHPGSTVYTPFSSRVLTLDERTGRLLADAQPPYLVVPANYLRFRPAQLRAFADPHGLLVAVEAERPYRADWSMSGVDYDRWTLANPRVRFFPDPARALTERRIAVTMQLAPNATRRSYRLTGAGRPRTGTIADQEVRREVVCVSVPRGEVRDLRIEVRRTPSGDGRRVGVRMAAIEELPLPPGGCAPAGR